KNTPHYLFSRMSNNRSDSMAVWWEFFRKREPNAPLSDLLRRLDAIFVKGEAGKDFDAWLVAAEMSKDFEGPDAQDAWLTHVAQACIAVGKIERAEANLKKAAQRDRPQYKPLGDFYLERRKWADAADAYEKALKLKPTDTTTM